MLYAFFVFQNISAQLNCSLQMIKPIIFGWHFLKKQGTLIFLHQDFKIDFCCSDLHFSGYKLDIITSSSILDKKFHQTRGFKIYNLEFNGNNSMIIVSVIFYRMFFFSRRGRKRNEMRTYLNNMQTLTKIGGLSSLPKRNKYWF